MMTEEKEKTKVGGFSLIEIIVAMAMFALIIGGVTLFGINSINSQKKSRAMQETLENAQYAMDLMSRKIRTSSDISGNSSQLFFIDNVDSSSFCYRFNNDKIEVAKDTSGGGSSCSHFSSGDFVDLAGANYTRVDGSFSVVETDLVSHRRGYVRIAIEINYAEGATVNESDFINIQSTVSLRDYDEDEE